MTDRVHHKKLERALRLAQGGFSRPRYSDWTGVAELLLGKGYSAHETAALMVSKVARWAGDFSSSPYGQVTVEDFEAYMSHEPSHFTPEAVAQLVTETTFWTAETDR